MSSISTTRQKIRIILLGLILLFSLGVVIMIFTHQEMEDTEEIMQDIAVEADAALSHFTYTQIENGKAKWNLEAEHGTHDAKSNVTNLGNVHAEFFGDTSEGDITMTADTAEASLDEETIIARGNVIITTASGYRLKSPTLKYSRAKSEDQSEDTTVALIHTSEPVYFEGQGIHIQGVGMTYRIESRFLQIHDDVRAHVRPRSGP